MKILVGYDGSEHSEAALTDLKRAGLPDHSQIILVSVADLLMSRPSLSDVAAEVIPLRVQAVLENTRTHGEKVMKEAEDSAAKAAERLRSEFPDWNIATEVVAGTPAWELIDAAERWKVDLVVVGSHGRSAIGRIFLGSVSKRVVTDSHCSVRVARPLKSGAENRPPRVVLGVDGSLAAEQAIYAVGQRAWPAGTEVRLIAVDDNTPPNRIATRLPQAAEMISSYNQKREERAGEMLEWAITDLGAIGLKTEISLEKGDPSNIIVNRAREWQADSIFVGTRDFKNSFERFRLGSVSTAVMHNAHCSVEIVRSLERGEQ